MPIPNLMNMAGQNGTGRHRLPEETADVFQSPGDRPRLLTEGNHPCTPHFAA